MVEERRCNFAVLRQRSDGLECNGAPRRCPVDHKDKRLPHPLYDIDNDRDCPEVVGTWPDRDHHEVSDSNRRMDSLGERWRGVDHHEGYPVFLQGLQMRSELSDIDCGKHALI
jgi:hypothetical protein